MIRHEGPVPLQEHRTIEGRLELTNDDIKELVKMAIEATGHAASSFQYMYEAAYQVQDQGLHDQLTKLESETLGTGIVNIGEYFSDVDANVWSIPVLDADGNQLADAFYVDKLNVKDMIMLCSALGPFVENAQSEEEQYAHHIVFKASYVEPSQKLEILWDRGSYAAHPDIEALQAQFGRQLPPEGQPIYTISELYKFRDKHSRKLEELRT